MSKTKSGFFCQQCGYESAKWVGKCPGCENWNTFVEEIIVKGNDKKENNEWKEYNGVGKLKTISINDVSSAEEKRIITNDAEVNRVLGGGIVLGSIVLVAGEPGIGKSTFCDLITGFHIPDSGEIFLNDMRVGDFLSSFPGSISYLPQRNYLISSYHLEKF
jgi:DNA repair protein RadA/Sms